MRKWLVLIVIIICVVFVEWMREIHIFKVTHYNIQSPKLKNVRPRKILVLSDLHNCQYGKENAKLLQAIYKEEPDIILIAGDMLVGKKGAPTEVAKKLVEKLPEICDTYYANGNHEQRVKEDTEKYEQAYQEYKEYLTKCGVQFLENEKAQAVWENCQVEIWGLEIPGNAYKKFHKVTLPEGYVEETIGKTDLSKYQILIAHNPKFMKEYLEWGADLIVSGHFHGGVARIPFWRGVISPQGGLFPKYSGELTKEGDTSIVVSKGIGLHTIRVRFLNPAEIVVLHIGDSEE